MTAQFGAKSTTDEVLAGATLTGKRVLVTGVSAGLGVETARALAAHGATVVGAARDLKKAERATEPVRRDAAFSGYAAGGVAWSARAMASPVCAVVRADPSRAAMSASMARVTRRASSASPR